MSDRRVDPDDGVAYTWEEFSAYYKRTFKKAAIEAYWEKCTPAKKAKAKAKVKVKAQAKAKQKTQKGSPHFGALSVMEADQSNPPSKRPGLAHRVTVSDLDPKMLEMKYAVRGSVANKAEEVAKALADGADLGFKQMVPCNIGNPHAVHQKPISFYREVAACVLCPGILDFKSDSMPSDVVTRAKEYLAATGQNGVGSYTHSNGLIMVRRQIAAFIEKRDGFPCDVERLALTTGASEGVKRCISALIGSGDGLMIPCPQYPLYSAALAMCGGEMVYYNLDEDKNWGISREELERSIKAATKKGTRVVSIAVINPGNPSGAVLDRAEVEMIITFARDTKIVILADEVYQENIYKDGKSFHSFKKILSELQKSDSSYEEVQLVSFHSTSKGLLGECGQRGGYAEFVGFSDRTMAQFTKVAATSLSCNTLGQIFCGLMVTPPAEDGPSYAKFKSERDSIYDGLKRRATALQDGLNAIEGISCQDIEGAMYAFPSMTIPKAAEAKAKEMQVPADEYWCIRLVEEHGIVCVPGSGFGQKKGTYHFRITVLPPDDMLKDCISRIKKFHEDFTKEFS
jgi:alanine transaminase